MFHVDRVMNVLHRPEYPKHDCDQVTNQRIIAVHLEGRLHDRSQEDHHNVFYIVLTRADVVPEEQRQHVVHYVDTFSGLGDRGS